MWILVVEALCALGALLFIVWWTLGPTHRRERDALQRAAREQAVAGAARGRASPPRETVAAADGRRSGADRSASAGSPPDSA